MRLGEWREAAGLTQQAVADRLGAHFSAVGRWEMGTRDPSAAMKRRIFLLSDGAVTPEDYYDVPAWRRQLVISRRAA